MCLIPDKKLFALCKEADADEKQKNDADSLFDPDHHGKQQVRKISAKIYSDFLPFQLMQIFSSCFISF